MNNALDGYVELAAECEKLKEELAALRAPGDEVESKIVDASAFWEDEKVVPADYARKLAIQLREAQKLADDRSDWNQDLRLRLVCAGKRAELAEQKLETAYKELALAINQRDLVEQQLSEAQHWRERHNADAIAFGERAAENWSKWKAAEKRAELAEAQLRVAQDKPHLFEIGYDKTLLAEANKSSDDWFHRHELAEQQLADEKDDATRLHREKMELWEAIELPGGYKQQLIEAVARERSIADCLDGLAEQCSPEYSAGIAHAAEFVRARGEGEKK